MSFYANYISYFEQLARKHVSIAHTDSECHFTPISIVDFKNGIVSRIKFNHLLLLKPDFMLTNDRSGNLIKKYTGQLMILGKVSERETTHAAKNTIIDSLEAINDEIIARMLNDVYVHNEAGSGLFKATAETLNISGSPVGASDINPNYFGSSGWFLQFDIVWPIQATPTAAKWTDPENIIPEED